MSPFNVFLFLQMYYTTHMAVDVDSSRIMSLNSIFCRTMFVLNNNKNEIRTAQLMEEVCFMCTFLFTFLWISNGWLWKILIINEDIIYRQKPNS